MNKDLTPGPSPQERGAMPSVHDQKAESKRRMIKKLFAIGYAHQFQILWHQEERNLTASQRVAKHLNQWLTTHKESPVKKPFTEMTARELQICITVFEKIDRWHLQQINKTQH